MEDNNSKKKRNKKKKNKLSKTAEDDAISVAVGGVDHQNGVSDNGKNDDDNSNNIPIADQTVVRNCDLQNVYVHDFDGHRNNGTETFISIEAEEHQWRQREATLKETVKQLQNENDSYIQKEVILRKSVKQLQEEKDMHIQNQLLLEDTIKDLRFSKDSALQKEVTLEEAMKELRTANNSALKKEVILEETIKELRNVNDSLLEREGTFKETVEKLKFENDIQMQKEADLEKKIAELESEKELYLQEETGLEEKLQRLLDENDALGLKRESLEEKVKQLESDKFSRTLIENTTKETISRMNIDIARLQMQVVEVEESRSCLFKENQQLLENISELRLQLQNHDCNMPSANAIDEIKKHALERENLESQIEAACTLVDKLITENADLVEKVNELFIKLDRQSPAVALSSVVDNDLRSINGVITSISDSLPESSENMSVVVHKLESLEIEPAAELPYTAEADSGQIVQIPLDDNELRDLELQTVESHNTEPVPMSDAPLIGAPFRLISFVAKYVTGADLVD
ncbi:uncharacterized protein LOC126664861 [Mercurialis annua]|uniref:uncharacterized protein LOC126664861 n=1 Tax=Mercurialis annua TaxID=3986 RepID=UPI0021608BD5|nr:uncharacterized protein LOC126664861 [Mercurialis annua]XP_050213411.1 uncharacterized protein LOC126664861 [Mercurialis annua]